MEKAGSRMLAARRALAVACVALGALALSATAGAAQWVKLDKLSFPRAGVAAATAPNGLVYAIGGANGSTGPVSDVEVYDAATNHWRKGPAVPERGDCRYPELCGVAFAIAATGGDGRIYLFDGNPDFPLAMSLDPNAGTWRASTPMPTPRPGVAGVAGKDGHIYALGGVASLVDHSLSRKNEVFDPTTQLWVTRAPMPRARLDHSVATAPDGRIYVLGGRVGETVLDAVDVYDPATNSWSTAAPMPSARYEAGAAFGRDGRLYVFGGGSAAGEPQPLMTDVYDPAANTWSSVPGLKELRRFMGVAIAPRGSIMAIGGDRNTARRTVEALRLGR